MFKKIKKRLQYERAKRIRPHMISGYRSKDGNKLRLTRVSNTTYIDSPEKLDIADNVFIGHFNFIDASNGLKIGEGCQITNYISILTHSSHISIRLYGKEYSNHSDLKGYLKGSVEIDKYTFVGPHSVIMPGSKIGKGCLVSAFSFVEGDFPDFSIIKGNPAVVVGDTRKMDEPLLKQFPELREYYKNWAE
jgi:acetyltransferase-like isoleucine patch superfamily enzyme